MLHGIPEHCSFVETETHVSGKLCSEKFEEPPSLLKWNMKQRILSTVTFVRRGSALRSTRCTTWTLPMQRGRSTSIAGFVTTKVNKPIRYWNTWELTQEKDLRLAELVGKVSKQRKLWRTTIKHMRKHLNLCSGLWFLTRNCYGSSISKDRLPPTKSRTLLFVVLMCLAS